jgi:molecular chaperone HscB
MKRVAQYKKLFQVEETITLSDLKKTYRKLVKEWHPDKFQDGDPLKEEAELKSTEIIDAYHFLVSIAPETKEQQLPIFTETITTSMIADLSLIHI